MNPKKIIIMLFFILILLIVSVGLILSRISGKRQSANQSATVTPDIGLQGGIRPNTGAGGYPAISPTKTFTGTSDSNSAPTKTATDNIARQTNNSNGKSPGTVSSASRIISDKSLTQAEKSSLEQLRQLGGYRTDDFIVVYDANNGLVIEKKTAGNNTALDEWLKKNDLDRIASNPEQTTVIDDTDSQYFDPEKDLSKMPDAVPTVSADQITGTLKPNESILQMADILRIILNPSWETSSTVSPAPTIASPGINSGNSPTYAPSYPVSTNYVYYSQMDPRWGNQTMPNGCLIRNTGCGPSTVAEILSTYVNSQYNPPAVINYYRNKNYYIGCNGSYFYDAKAVLNQMGITTGSVVSYNARGDAVIQDMKQRMGNQWTIFALVVIRNIGHFIWITDIDQAGNVWAYDVAWGTGKPAPINENRFSPDPFYKAVFLVKK